jgi:ABC-type branched-subunit amino acid transport system ATPase component/branched-subunit amino acid ABC-type transport system permease component
VQKGDEKHVGVSSPRGDSIARLLERITREPDLRFGLNVGLGTLAFLVFVTVVYPAPVAVLFLGMVLGSLSALVAMGLVLVYRANRIVNFAQGDLGGLAAVLAASLIVGPKWPYIPAAIVGLLTAITLGAVTEFGIVRRFAKAPRLILTVVTIGLQQLFAAGQLALPALFDYDVAPQPPLPFNVRFEWFPVTFNAGHLLILIIVPLAGLGLAAFFRYTDIGIAVRASAESADRAALLGVPVKRIGTLVWALAAGMSGLGVLLRLPIQGVSIGDVLGPSLLLRALAAAVIGRMESLPVTFGAAIVLGMVEQSVLFSSNTTIIVDAVMFFVILGALLLQRRGGGSRAEEAGISTWTAIREVRPIPRELARLGIVRWTLTALAIGGAAFLIVVPLAMSGGTVSLFGAGLIAAMLLLSLVVLTGWAGQISLGHLAFAAFGAAVAGSLAQQGKNIFLSLLVAGLVGTLVAMVIGIPALRIRGLFLAVTTLAFAVTTGTYFINEEYFPWLVPDTAQRINRGVLFEKFDMESEHTFYYFVLAATALVLGSVWSLRHSRTGRALVSSRDNPRAAQSYGISPVRARLTAFGLAGFIAAFAGGIFFYHQHALSNTVLESPQNLRIFSVAVIGGLGSIPGAVIGAAYQTLIEFSPLTRVPETRLFATGLGVLVILMLFPAGFGGLVYDVRDALLRRVARRRDIVVPSLLADVRVLEEDNGRTEPARAVRGRSRAPADALLHVETLDVAYGKAQVLFGVDFYVSPGEIVALLGTNGAGKSTLLGAISGLVTPIGGSITYQGRDITKAGPNDTVADGIVLMPGARGVFPTLTVAENLRLAAWLYRKDPDYVRQATDQVLTYFPVLRERWAQKAGNLSGGEQQMLTLSQVFIAKPRLLMIDELSLGLAPIIVERLLDIVRAIHSSGTAVVLVEQSVNIAVTLAERAAFLEKGEVRFEGPTSALLDRPDLLRAVFLSDQARRSSALAEVHKEPFVAKCRTCGREHGIALNLSELSVGFGGIRAVDDVSLDVHEHQILGIIGPNGAGKTTVFDAISGFVQLSSGRLHLNGTDVTDRSPNDRALLGLGRSFQDARLFPAMTVRQTIATALDRHVKVRDPIAAFVMSPAVRASERQTSAEVDRLVALLNLEAFADKFVGELSTGTRRIVDLACSLAHDPYVLLLDEPSSGLAQRETEALGQVLVDVRDRTGAALIVIEHDIPLVSAISDELVALELGRVVARGEPDTVIHHPAVVEGYLGSSEAAIRRSGRAAARQRKSRGRKQPARAKR